MTRRWIWSATLQRERVTHHSHHSPLRVAALRLERVLALIAAEITGAATLDGLGARVEV
ncbi:MAG: hypothetical protein M3304_02310 [Actinomycetota bacterium]|nr:hypothetical protein [Actinomycetota bacterium]